MTAVRKELRRRRKPIGLVTALVALTAVLVFAFSASSTIGGSPFEADDGNLVTNGNPDWATVSEARKQDQPTGQQDDSFGQGTKEDTAVPTVVNGSIPNNKSDLKFFGVYNQTTAGGGSFMELFWTRVQEPNGTTNMDFEFNQSSQLSANGVTPVRTAGDVLIQYDLAQGGTHPVLSASRWVTTGAGSQCEANNAVPCWGTKVNLTTSGDATGAINTSPISAADSDGLGALGARTFGEAEVNLAALGGGPGHCFSFGSAYLKSRASDSFTAAVKDFIAPETINVGQCGKVIIRKVTDPVSDPAQVQFGYTKSINTDPATANTFTLGHGQNQTYNNVLPGTGYSVVEDTLPADWLFQSIDCSASAGVTPSISGATITFDIDAASDVLDCTYTNIQQLGAIKVTKTRKHAADGPGDHPHAGVSFTVNGVTKQTDANGEACFDGLAFDTYTVHEAVPAGYHVDANDKQVAVDNNAKCSDSPYVGETVSFHNTPLTDLRVAVNSQVDGGTASTVSCTPAGPSGSTDANGDFDKTTTNLEPGTYVCTVVVDP